MAKAAQSKLDEALARLRSAHGDGIVMRMDDSPKDMDVIPSGNPLLDDALGVGGYPLGRIIEAYGPESSGKSTLATQMVAQAQAMGEMCAYVDAEHAFDPVYAGGLGVDVDSLLVSQPDYGEMAFEVVEELAASGELRAIVVDSVAALTPQAEIQGTYGDSHVGLQARLMSQAMRKLKGIVYDNNVVLFFINQQRDTIGTFGYGPKTTTTGGRALKYYASQRLEVKKTTPIKKGEDVVGYNTDIKVVKNKVAPPFRTAKVEMIFGQGFSFEGAVLDIGMSTGLVSKSGAWFSATIGGENIKLGNGREAAREYLRTDPDLALSIMNAVKEAT